MGAPAEAPPYTPFSVSLVPRRAEIAVVVLGEVDLASASQVADAVAEVRAAGFTQIVIDLSQVDFVDSTAVQMLLDVRDRALREGYSLTLVRPAPLVERIFDLTMTRELFSWRERPAR